MDALKRPSGGPAAVIDALGFGPAQIRCLLLGHGVWFVEAIQTGISGVLTNDIANRQAWGGARRSHLALLPLVGIALGSLAGGYLGDRVGRRPPILACYALMGAAQLAMTCGSTFWFAATMRFLLGFSQGLGMPPSLALVSEVSPQSHRGLLQGLRNILCGMGQTIACLICLIDDPSYQNMHWRACFLIGAIPPLLILPFAAAHLLDSPALLADLGRHEEAKKCLRAIQSLNSKDALSGDGAVDIFFSTHGTFSQDHPAQKGIQHRMRFMFDRRLFPSSLTLVMASFFLHGVLCGHLSIFPLVTSTEAAASGLEPGYRIFRQVLVGIPVSIVVVFLSIFMSCRSMLALGGAVGAVGTLSFGLIGGLSDSFGVLNFANGLSQNMPTVCCALGFLAAFQLSVDLYPVQVAATSAAVVVAGGRAGSFLVPRWYDLFHSWHSFYFLLTGLNVLTVVMATRLLAHSPSRDQRHDRAADLASREEIDTEALPLVLSPPLHEWHQLPPEQLYEPLEEMQDMVAKPLHEWHQSCSDPQCPARPALGSHAAPGPRHGPGQGADEAAPTQSHC